MKTRVTVITVLISILTSGTIFSQRQLTRNEILKAWTTNQKPINKDSLFRFEIHEKTRMTLDKLLGDGVDALVVYCVSYPGYQEMNSDSCSTIYPVGSYFFWRQQGKDYLKKVNGKCGEPQLTTNDKVMRFALNNFSKMTDEFFMSVMYKVLSDGDKLIISGNVIDHEPNYEIFLQIGNKFKYLRFTDSELTDKKSLFYDYNHDLTSLKLFGLIKSQLKRTD